jgi:predicted nucleotidyltransferase
VASRMPKEFSRGSRSRFVDAPRLRAELRDLCRIVHSRYPAVEKVLLFGSLAQGRARPHSDADLLVILSESQFSRRMDRIPALIEAFSPTPVPIDFVPWTCAEFDAGLASGDRWLLKITATAVQLWP